ncbi:sensor histidine kinase [Actinophytocola sp.]|uniref:sensor histidine kinase n=1 Tax=Actinophytocola sp. TaxID=1872138 RepID=UPI0039C8A5CD
MRRWRVRRLALLLVVFEVVLLAAAITAGAYALNQLTAARERVVDQVDPQLTQAQNLTAALLNQETGLRGYQLSGQRDFLTPYEEGREAQDQAVARLRALGATAGSTAGVDLDVVLDRTRDWRETADQLIAAGVAAEPALVELGKTEFDQVRAGLDTLRGNLEQVRATDRQALNDSATLLSVMFGAIAVLLLVAFVLLTFGFNRTVVQPLLGLARQVRDVTEHDIHREVHSVGGPRELVQLASDVEAMRRRIVTEVGELHRAHELLDARTQALQRSNSDLEQFAYVASHDLQEPLRKVASFCQLLQRRYAGSLDERGEQYIEFAVDGAKRMQVLINDLLAFSRVGRRSGEQTVVDTAELFAAAVGNLEPVIEDTGARITHSGLPRVRGEASLLTAVFQNLISNALKFHGEAAPQVRVDAVRNGGEWEFSVTDNGIGIEAEYADRIFVIFQRLHPKNAYPGTGIGLAMCRKIIEHHGGRIWLDTESGGAGTRFRFTLPALAEVPAADTADDSALATAGSKKSEDA